MEKDVGVTAGVRTLWQEDLLLDYTIEVEDQMFKVHKVIMASVSDYFKVMLTGGMVESQTDRVRLEGLDPLAMSNMIEYMYTGQFGSTEANTEELLACAVYLQIASAIELCSEVLLDKLDDNNCFDILTIFKTFCLTSGIEDTIEYIENNLEDVLEVCNVNELSHDNLYNLLQIWGKSEWDSFISIEDWLNTDSDQRRVHLNDLMCQIRFSLMTPAEIVAVKATDVFLTSEGSWHELVDKAIGYHNLPVYLKVLETSEQSEVREEASPLCFPSGDRRADGCYSLQGVSWEEHEAFLAPEFTRSPAAVINVNNFLIVSDYLHTEQNWYIFDPRNMTWSSMAGMNTPRRFFALAHHDDHLYAFGGETGGQIKTRKGSTKILTSIEKYDFSSNTWRISKSKLLVPLKYPSACTLDDFIYVCGGKASSLDVFDPTTGVWQRKPRLLGDSVFHQIQPIQLGVHKAIGIMTDGFRFQYYIPNAAHWAVIKCGWKFDLCKNLHWHPGGTDIMDGRCVFLLNFQSGQLGKCIKWTIEDEDNISEVILDDLPICPVDGDERLYFGASMSVPPKSEQPVE